MKRTHCKKWRILLAVLTLSLILCSCVQVAATRPVTAEADMGERITRILILGCDRSASLADSIMLVAINETRREARILQIPRDTYAEYTSRSYKKLNGAINALGEERTEAFLEDALGVEIHCFVKLNPDALVSIVNAIGGVEVEIPQDMDYSDPAQGLEIHLSAGKRRLTGAEAEQFVRYRSGYANADLGRLDAQKLFLSALAKRCQRLSAMEMLKVAFYAMTKVQTNIGVHDAVRLAGVLRSCNAEKIPMATLPGGAVRGVSGAWYYAVNREGGCRAVNEYLYPSRPLDVTEFDKKGVFDRESHPDFHAVYTAEEDKLARLLDQL